MLFCSKKHKQIFILKFASYCRSVFLKRCQTLAHNLSGLKRNGRLRFDWTKIWSVELTKLGVRLRKKTGLSETCKKLKNWPLLQVEEATVYYMSYTHIWILCTYLTGPPQIRVPPQEKPPVPPNVGTWWYIDIEFRPSSSARECLCVFAWFFKKVLSIRFHFWKLIVPLSVTLMSRFLF